MRKVKWKKIKMLGIICILFALGIGTSQKIANILNNHNSVCDFAEEIINYKISSIFLEKNLEYDKGTQDKKWFIFLEKIMGKEEMLNFYYLTAEEVDDDIIANMKKENSKVKKKEFLVEKKGEVEKKEIKKEKKTEEQKVKKNVLVEQLRKNKDVNFLLENFYIVDRTTSVDKKVFDVEKFLERDFTFEKKQEPQILICHTHGGTEYFADGTTEEASIVSVGSYLTKILEEKYGYQVIHDETKYDCINYKKDRNKAYSYALDGVSQILEKNPSIKVVIDLHRDGVNSSLRRVTTIDGKNVAQFMIFNGLSRNQTAEISYLKNPNLQDNLAFGLQLKLHAMELYPDLTIKNYLKAYRYNMHLRERFLLIELGNENSTTEEAKNTMPYLAEILNGVIEK